MKNKKIELDWKVSVEDVIYNVEQLLGDLPVKYVGERQIFGDWFEVVILKDKEILIPQGNPGEIEKIVEIINKVIGDKKIYLEFYQTGGDSYGLELVDNK